MSSADLASSLRDLDRPADRIRQHRQVSDCPVVVVEGPHDCLVLGPHLTGIDIFPADGKPNAIETARTLLSWQVENFVCVTDRDFDDPKDTADLGSVYYPYGGRDLEAMLIDLGVLGLVLEHQGSETKIATCGGVDALVQEIKCCVRPVTALRAHNARFGWGLCFDGVSLASKVEKDLTLKVVGYCSALVHVSNAKVSVAEVREVAEKWDGADQHRGKDVVAVAGVAQRKRAGTLSLAATDETVLTGQLHSSCGLALARSAWLKGLLDHLTPVN